MYILDTNTLIYFFKGVGGVAETLLSKTPRDIGLPAIVLYEILVGVKKSTASPKRKQQLEHFVSIVNMLSFGHPEAEFAAGIRAGLEMQGRTIGPYDVLIAATALSNSGILVTHNTKEFSRVEGLQIEDWY